MPGCWRQCVMEQPVPVPAPGSRLGSGGQGALREDGSSGSGAEGIRTLDPLVANQVLSQLSYRPRNENRESVACTPHEKNRLERFRRSGIPHRETMTQRTLGLILMSAAQTTCARGTQAAPLRLGTTTTVDQSGALALVDSLHPPMPVRVVVGASGTILRSAAAGDLDVVVTHAPSLEQRLLVEPGRAALRCPFVVSRFAIVGPAAD